MNTDELLTRGVVNLLPNKKALEQALKSGKKLNVYLGIDPTATRIHLGHAVVLRKLQSFAEMGHNVTFLIGDFTALIGDTSDKDKERPSLIYKEIKENFKTYKQQAEKVLDYTQVKVKFNSKWLKKLSFEDIIKLCQHFSVGDFVGRTLIKTRLGDNKRVALHEMLYPVMQGYDSYFLDTDVQIGAADQTFNMQAGRTLMKDLRDRDSFVLVTDYLIGTDGTKMSKSIGNAIWLDDTPTEMYGKVLSIKDDLIEHYFLLATNTALEEIKKMKKIISTDPLESKKRLAYTIVSEMHSENDAKKAQGHFEKTFQKGDRDYDVEIASKDTLATTLAQVNSIGSMSEAKRRIANGAVYVNETKVTDPGYIVKSGDTIKAGKKDFFKIT